MKKTAYITSLIIITFLMACKKDFIVENIDNKTMTVNAPANNLITTLNLITFWWEPVDGAEKYNLQIVKPAFGKVAQVIADTNVTNTKFNFSLQPGMYQWRIKATNAGHATAFQTFNLRIDSTTNLAAQFVNMLSPASGNVTGNKVVTFNWSSLIAASKYRLQINNGSVKDSVLTGTSLTYILPAAANATTAYTWNVKAINSTSESQFNATAYTFTVDLKPPTSPGLTRPMHGISVTDTAMLVWYRNGTDVQYDSIYVADDSTFANVRQYIADQPKVQLSDLQLNPNAPGIFYWWRIRSFDAVGNRSSFSGKLKFKLVP